MEVDSKTESSEVAEEEKQLEVNGNQNGVEDQHVLQLLDSADDYLTLLDSVSSTLRQGWLELTSARHSMGALRVNGALLDMKPHTAATVLQVTEDDIDLKGCNVQFTLCKWANSDTGKYSFGEENIREDKLHKSPVSPQLRHRSISHVSEIPEKTSSHDGASLVDDQVQRERTKSLSVFGTLVSPKLRDAQLSFETALEKLVEIANARGRIIYAYNQVRKELECTK